MNSADVAQSVLPLTSSDLSLLALFWSRALARQDGDGRAAGCLGLGLGDRDRQVPAVLPHPARDGPLRAGVLVRASRWRSSTAAVGAPGPFDGGAVRRRDARMEAQLRRARRARSPACRCASRR